MMMTTNSAASPLSPASEDAETYLRHVEEGVSIRALARELGCHASTVMRRIRKFENRRDDPLVDAALTGASAKGENAESDLRFRRILRRLAEPGAELITDKDLPKALVVRDAIQTAILDRDIAEQMALRGWIAQARQLGKVQRYVLVPMGREALRQMINPDSKPAKHVDQNRVWATKTIQDPEDGRRKSRRVNIAESPLMLLARRRDQNGKPFLTQGMVAAGERLREDFELAQLGPRVTQNWDRFMTAGIDVSHNSQSMGGSESARNRVAHALRELGPGMGDVAFRVCCFLEGIEMTERRLGWSARSGKVVLRLALMRLEKHYRDLYGTTMPLIG